MSHHPFRFGLINEQMLHKAAWLDSVRATEAAGFATWLLRDHVVPDFFGDQYAPLIALTYAASVTTRLRLGTMVACNDFRHPVMLAKELATLDALSDGRVELGLGAGWLRREYEQAGWQYDQPGVRITRLAESVALLRQLWSGQPTHFTGQHYQVDGLVQVPVPIQQPLPILIGGGHQRILTLAGQIANLVGILTSSVASGTLVEDPAERMPAAVQQKLRWIAAGAGPRYDSIELSLIPTLIITDQRRTSTEAWLASKSWSGITPEQVWQMPSVLIGSLDQICADLAERRESYGFSYFIFSDSQREQAAQIVARLAGA